MGNIVLVGDSGGWVQAYDKRRGAPVSYGGYPLRLSTEPYKTGAQGEKWWEPIGGTATQMTVAAGMMLVGVNSESDERTVLKAFRLHRLPDLALTALNTPATSNVNGFVVKVRAVCLECSGNSISTSVSLRVAGYELNRQAVTFQASNGWEATLTWNSGPVPPSSVKVVATVDPDNEIDEVDETNNSLQAPVVITTGATGTQNADGWGSKLTD